MVGAEQVRELVEAHLSGLNGLGGVLGHAAWRGRCSGIGVEPSGELGNLGGSKELLRSLVNLVRLIAHLALRGCPVWQLRLDNDRQDTTAGAGR